MICPNDTSNKGELYHFIIIMFDESVTWVHYFTLPNNVASMCVSK